MVFEFYNRKTRRWNVFRNMEWISYSYPDQYYVLSVLRRPISQKYLPYAGNKPTWLRPRKEKP